jgi:hypothetical protein
MFRNNGYLDRAMMGRFGRLIDDLGLKDLPLHGRNYTWSNLQDRPDVGEVRYSRVCSVDREHLLPKSATERVLPLMGQIIALLSRSE